MPAEVSRDVIFAAPAQHGPPLIILLVKLYRHRFRIRRLDEKSIAVVPSEKTCKLSNLEWNRISFIAVYNEYFNLKLKSFKKLCLLDLSTLGRGPNRIEFIAV